MSVPVAALPAQMRIGSTMMVMSDASPQPGRAMGEATRAFHHAGSDAAPRRLGDLTLSSIGLGTYLGSDDDETDALYAEAIGRSLDSGVNVIDTAINYRSQHSERVIGAVLRERIGTGRLARGAVFIASKAGYVPFDGRRPRQYAPWLEETYLKTGIIPRAELVNGVHCMAPGYLADQIERSRRNLGLDTIDLYYLHNPESGMEGVDPREFRRRLREAFAALESAVERGAIGMYGTATWSGYRQVPGESPRHSLVEMLAIAREVAGEAHHFRAIQLPYNLAYIEAHATATQELGDKVVPLLEAAAASGIYVMTSAPLLQGQLASRLPDEVRAVLGLASDAQRAVQFARSTPGVGTVLVGMKRVAHVAEMATVAKTPPISAERIESLFAGNT
nr:hypothetical protein [uncultured bacterium]